MADEELLEEPSYKREFLKALWSFVKWMSGILAIAGIVLGGAWIIIKHIASEEWFPAIFLAIIVLLEIVGASWFIGWTNYKSKKREWERQQRERGSPLKRIA
jgi:hypothetical protein